MMEESNKKVSSKSIVKNLFNLQIGINADQALFSYHTTLNSLMNLKPTKGLLNDPIIGSTQISEMQFNSKGNLLANSFWVDDNIQIWDWFEGTLKKIFSTGHNFTVMHFNWVPCDDDNLFVTSGQQGDIRLTDLTTNDTRVLLQSYIDDANFGLPRGYRFSVTKNLPHTILAAGRSGKIVHIDVRDCNPTDLFTIKYDDTACYEIHGLDINPLESSEFCVGGINNIRTYDHRYSSQPVREFSLLDPEAHDFNSSSMQESQYVNNVKYNFNGSEVLVTTNTDRIYLFDTLQSDTRKKFTIVNSRYQAYDINDVHFCGQKSEFVITISSTRQEFQRFQTIYIWDKETQELVREIPLTDDSWRFTVHPTLPVLAMNLDHDGIRLWE